MIESGQIPKELPLPCSTNIVGRLYLKLRKNYVIVDVWPHYSDGELVWRAYRWSGRMWCKIPERTRTDSRCYPKTVARKACEFLSYCKDNAS